MIVISQKSGELGARGECNRENENPIGDTVRELSLLGTKIRKRAYGAALCVQGDKVAGMEVGAGRADAERLRFAKEEINHHAAGGAYCGVHTGCKDRSEDFIPGGDGGRNAGLIRV